MRQRRCERQPDRAGVAAGVLLSRYRGDGPLTGDVGRHASKTTGALRRATRMSRRQPNVSLALASRAENVVLVREVLAGLADAVDFGGALDDIKAAVSEACNNVVVHAYDSAEGPLEVEVVLSPSTLEVLVRDHGAGTPRSTVDESSVSPGIGLTVIEALAARTELRSDPGRGTEVTMWFALPNQVELPAPPEATGEPFEVAADVSVVIAPPQLSAPVLNRLVGALAARAGFSIDRLSDAQMLTDALGAGIGSALSGGRVSVTIDDLGPRAMALSVGGLAPGGSSRLLAGSKVGELGSVLERLSDEIDTGTDERGETLRIVLRDQRKNAR